MPAAALLPAVALLAGSAAGLHLHLPSRGLIWTLPLLNAAAILTWLFRAPRCTLALIVVAFGCCGVVLGAKANAEALDTPLRRAVDADARSPVLVRVRLTEDAAAGDDAITLRARVIALRTGNVWAPTDGGVVLSVGGAAGRIRFAQWRRGRVLEAPVTFRRPARYLNDGVVDFEREAALDGITLLGSIKSGLVVETVSRGSAANELAADARAYVRRSVARHVAPQSALSAAIVSAVLIGDRSGLPETVRDRLQAAGTYHVIAISGGNIAIFTTIVALVMVPFGLGGRRGAAATLILLLAYAFVVTAGPSVWRATVVAVVYIVARVLDHRSAAWQAMAIAAGILAVTLPLDVRNAGFILTFGATAALLEAARRSGDRFGWVVTSIVASVAVEIALLPVMAATFSRVTAAGVVLNLIAVPAMAIVQLAGAAVVCADAAGGISRVAGWVAHLAAVAIVESARLVDVAPWLAFRVPAPSVATIAIYYASLALALFSRAAIARVASLVTLIVCAVLIIAGTSVRSDVAGLRLTMVDVGQGEAMALEVPGGHTLMIDSGGAPFGDHSFDIGSRVVEPALWARGIASLDTLLLTHGDPDHIGGAIPVLADLRPTTLWRGVPVPRAAPLQALLMRAAASGVAVEERREGEEFRIGAARALVLHPPLPDWERQRVRNDDSVVLEVIYGDVALLLTGDISSDIERQIAPRLVPAKTRILKVAHHGSRTSTSPELLADWRPQIALISCGRNNTFGHPAPDVIARLEAVGARIYRTDRDGEITVETDGQHVNVRTFVGDNHGPRRSRR